MQATGTCNASLAMMLMVSTGCVSGWWYTQHHMNTYIQHIRRRKIGTLFHYFLVRPKESFTRNRLNNETGGGSRTMLWLPHSSVCVCVWIYLSVHLSQKHTSRLTWVQLLPTPFLASCPLNSETQIDRAKTWKKSHTSLFPVLQIQIDSLGKQQPVHQQLQPTLGNACLPSPVLRPFLATFQLPSVASCELHEPIMNQTGSVVSAQYRWMYTISGKWGGGLLFTSITSVLENSLHGGGYVL